MAGPEIYVIDASAAVEYLLATDTGLQVAELTAAARLIAPELLDAEVLSALRQAVLRGQVAETEAQAALAKLSEWPVERISHRTFISAAWELRHNISAYDALYVAIARAYGATILTVDARLARAPAASLGVTVRDLSIG